MGCFKMSVGHHDEPRLQDIPAGNPNPHNFIVNRTQQAGRNLVAKIHYPDCDNFEGMKILVFRDTNRETLLCAQSVDPHFTDKDVLKPFARFEPTEEGWQMAIQVAVLMP